MAPGEGLRSNTILNWGKFGLWMVPNPSQGPGGFTSCHLKLVLEHFLLSTVMSGVRSRRELCLSQDLAGECITLSCVCCAISSYAFSRVFTISRDRSAREFSMGYLMILSGHRRCSLQSSVMNSLIVSSMYFAQPAKNHVSWTSPQ